MKFRRFLRVFTLVIIIWKAGVWYDNYAKCRTEHIQQACDHYIKTNSTYNKLCDSICNKKEIAIEECLLGTTLTKSVFFATVEDRKVVLKLDKSWFDNIKDIQKSFEAEKSLFNPRKYFKQIVFKYFGNDCKNCDTLVSKLLTMADADMDELVTPKEAISFGSLLMTREAFMLATLNETKTTTSFYGYCGPLYIVERVHLAQSKLIDTSTAFTDFWILPEFLEPLESFLKDFLTNMRESYQTFLTLHEFIYISYKKFRKYNVPTLQQRVDFVIGMIEVVHDHVSLDYGELFSCDLSLDNVGFSDLGNFSNVKQTDLDEIFVAANVFQKAQEIRCQSDEECEGVFGAEIRLHKECTSYCKSNGICSRKIRKSNLAYLCGTTFTDIFFNNVTLALSDEGPAPQKVVWLIVETLTECRNSAFPLNVEQYLFYIRTVADRFQEVKQLIKP